MADSQKTKKQLLDDLAKLRRKIARLESLKGKSIKVKGVPGSGRQKYLELYENLPDASAAINLAGKIVDCNAAFKKMLGYSLRELKKLTYEDITPAKWHAVEKSMLEKQVMKRGYSDVYRKEYRAKNGRIFPVELRAFLMHDDQKKPAGVFAIIRDVTEKLKNEQAIQNSEEKYRSLVETISDWVWEVNKNGVYTYASPKVEELLGYKPEEIIGKKPTDLMPQGESAHIKSVLGLAFKNHQPIANLVNLHLHKNGQIVVLETNARPIFTEKGKFAGYRGVDRDITVRKKAEDALKESEATLKSLFRAAPTGIGLVINRVFVNVNDRFCDMIGYARDELIGQSARMVYPSQEEYERVGKVKYDQIYRDGTGTIETRMLRKDGRVIHVLLSSTPLNPQDLSRGVTFTTLDITERKRAEEALQASEREKAIILNSVSENVTLQDKDLNILWANRAALESFDYENTPLLGKHCFEIWNRRQEACEGCPVKKALESGRPEEAEMITADGRCWWVRGFPVNDSSGDIIGAVEVTREITEEKLAEAKLIAERNFTDTVINSLPGIFYLFDDKGKFIKWNRNFEHISGYSGDEIAAMHPTEFFTGSDKELVAARIGEVFAVGRSQVEAHFTAKTGEKSPYYFTGYRLQMDDKLYLVGMGLDITELKHAEEMLRESEEKYRNVVERAYEGIVIIQDYLIKYSNPRLAEIIDRDMSELINAPYINFIHPDEIGKINDYYRRRLGGEQLPQIYETRLLHKSGATVYVELNGGIIQYQGRPADLAFIRDITEQKLLKEQFLQSQKMESIGRLAGGVAHDFNNLLTAIIGHSEIALLSVNKDSPVHKDIVVIQEAADRAADLTRQLLAFSRRQTLEPKIIDLNGIIENMGKMLQRIIGEDIALKTFPFKDLWPVKVDPGQIEQVIINLAVNARDAMPEGGVVSIETANVNLDSTYNSRHHDVIPGPFVMLSISDTGSGMSDEVKEHIFEPFYTTKSKGKGTGLGLSTVFGIVNQSEGHIWVYSELNKGTSFKIYLPRTEGQPQVIEPPYQHKEIPSGTESILVVEDETTVRQIACRALAKQGYKITESVSGQEAIELCRRPDLIFDLVITDVVMPNISGTEMMEEINKSRPDLRALYMSGYTENAIVEKGILKPGIFYIQKPFRPHDLAIKVREVLDQTTK